MNASQIESKFAMMGARLKVSVLPQPRASEDYAAWTSKRIDTVNTETETDTMRNVAFID